MKTFVLSTVAGAALMASTVGGAFADDHSTPGTPGTANCQGQTTAFLAQAAKNGFIDDAYHGIGGFGRYSDSTAKQVHELIQAYCAGELP